ncbi:rCG36723 [Rattus norvegicus]|uniref:RCG36723 n=1 Tax=Rattus norvegicus TaxID=10116 RepID=A6JRV5_RAT|nr:rCG36723 [Rattus norvegicus]
MEPGDKTQNSPGLQVPEDHVARRLKGPPPDNPLAAVTRHETPPQSNFGWDFNSTQNWI